MQAEFMREKPHVVEMKMSEKHARLAIRVVVDRPAWRS